MSETTPPDDDQDDDLAALQAAFPQDSVRAVLDDDASADYAIDIEYESDAGNPVLSTVEFRDMRDAGFVVSWLSGRSLYVVKEGEER